MMERTFYAFAGLIFGVALTFSLCIHHYEGVLGEADAGMRMLVYNLAMCECEKGDEKMCALLEERR